MRNLKSREVRLKSRPHGTPTLANFEVGEAPVAEPKFRSDAGRDGRRPGLHPDRR